MVVKSLKIINVAKEKQWNQCVHLQQFSRIGVVRRIFDADSCPNVLQAYLTIQIPYRMLECSRQHPSLPRIQKVPGLIFDSEIGNPEWENLILMYVLCILYSLLSRSTNAQKKYIYINNILYIVSTATCFHASALSSGSLNHAFC
jgi:hypothetical protein